MSKVDTYQSVHRDENGDIIDSKGNVLYNINEPVRDALYRFPRYVDQDGNLYGFDGVPTHDPNQKVNPEPYNPWDEKNKPSIELLGKQVNTTGLNGTNNSSISDIKMRLDINTGKKEYLDENGNWIPYNENNQINIDEL